jgi:hypothetical protein
VSFVSDYCCPTGKNTNLWFMGDARSFTVEPLFQLGHQPGLIGHMLQLGKRILIWRKLVCLLLEIIGSPLS